MIVVIGMMIGRRPAFTKHPHVACTELSTLHGFIYSSDNSIRYTCCLYFAGKETKGEVTLAQNLKAGQVVMVKI